MRNRGKPANDGERHSGIIQCADGRTASGIHFKNELGNGARSCGDKEIRFDEPFQRITPDSSQRF